MQYLGERNYRISIEPQNREVILSSLRQKYQEQKLDQIFLDFSNIKPESRENVSGLLKEMFAYFKHLKNVGFILNKVSTNYMVVEFAKQLVDLEYLYIQCIDKESLDLSFLLLNAVSLKKIQVFNMDFTLVSLESVHHAMILKAMKKMSTLDDVTLEFNRQEHAFQLKQMKYSFPARFLSCRVGNMSLWQNYLSFFPNLVKLHFDNKNYWFSSDEKKDQKWKPDAFCHLNQLQKLTITSIDFLMLKTLQNIRTLSITEEISKNVSLQDFAYLEKLNKFHIYPFLKLDNITCLDQIPSLPKGCTVKIRTLYFNQIKKLGKIPDINVVINNQYMCTAREDWIIPSYSSWCGIREIKNLVNFQLQMCHGERFSDLQILNFLTDVSYCNRLTQLSFSFFCKRERDACTFTKEQEKNFALNTDLVFLNTDLNLSPTFANFINLRQRTFLSCVAFQNTIASNLLNNPQACYFELFE